MTANYETEQHTLESRVVELKGTMTAKHDSAHNVVDFNVCVGTEEHGHSGAYG